MQAQAHESDLKKKVEAAVEKKAAFGEDIDLNKFENASHDLPRVDSLEDLDRDTQDTLLHAGIVANGEGRSGSFLLMDDSVVHNAPGRQGVEVMPVSEAVKKYAWMKDYYWKAVAPDADKFTARTFLEEADGYFIRALPGAKVKLPVQTCLMLKNKGVQQTVHNVIIAEEGSQLEVLTGCTTSKGVERALHLGISEFYVKKNASLTFSMIHNWAETIGVRPRTVILQEEGSTYVSNYVTLRQVKSIQTYPTARLNGANAVCQFNTVGIGHPGSELDLGTRAFLSAPGTRCEMVTRTISTGGRVVTRGQMIGEAKNIKGHLECRGLIVGATGQQVAIPELDARVPDVEMTHEAAVGKIAQDQVEYLMARGLTEDEAVGIIVRGFLQVGIRGLPEGLKREIDNAIMQTEVKTM
jgi:Fe-S cluster assembly scaffold protein SufB